MGLSLWFGAPPTICLKTDIFQHGKRKGNTNHRYKGLNTVWGVVWIAEHKQSTHSLWKILATGHWPLGMISIYLQATPWKPQDLNKQWEVCVWRSDITKWAVENWKVGLPSERWDGWREWQEHGAFVMINGDMCCNKNLQIDSKVAFLLL